MKDHESLRDLAEPYVLGGLDDRERRTFEAHMKTCASCAQTVRELIRVTEALGQLVDQREPPAGLRARVLDAIAPKADAGERPIDRTPDTRRAAPVWMAVAATVALVSAGAYGVKLRWNAEMSVSQARLPDAMMAEARRELARMSEAGEPPARARRILTANDLSHVELEPQPSARGAKGRAFASGEAGLLFSATDLPPLDSGTVYQLWVVKRETPESIGTFIPEAGGRATMTADLPVEVQPLQVALTIEPEGGRPAPTGAMILRGTLPPAPSAVR